MDYDKLFGFLICSVNAGAADTSSQPAAAHRR